MGLPLTQDLNRKRQNLCNIFVNLLVSKDCYIPIHTHTHKHVCVCVCVYSCILIHTYIHQIVVQISCDDIVMSVMSLPLPNTAIRHIYILIVKKCIGAYRSVCGSKAFSQANSQPLCSQEVCQSRISRHMKRAYFLRNYP